MARGPILTDSAGSENVFAEFFTHSDVGLAIFDQQLRYRMLNPYLAACNRTTIEAHLGKHVDEILGDISPQVRSAIQRVFVTGQPVLNYEVSGAFPTRREGGRWVDTFFPITDSTGKVEQVGVVVVELEATKHLVVKNEQSASPVTVLRSWKDIAQYLGTCVKTVQRWECEHAFPVRRVTPRKGAVVFALRPEVDLWLETRKLKQ
jgi:transcriptional regulator with PAS, ATPase and Fis domain